MPEGIRFPGGAEVWVPVALDGADTVDARTPFGGIARIPDGAELARVAAGLDGLELPVREVRAGPFDREVPRVVVRPYREEHRSGRFGYSKTGWCSTLIGTSIRQRLRRSASRT